jgi:hypothetical protein
MNVMMNDPGRAPGLECLRDAARARFAAMERADDEAIPRALRINLSGFVPPSQD